VDWFWAVAAFAVGVIVGAVLTTRRTQESTSETLGLKPGEKDQIMATLADLTAASAELEAKIDALIAAVQGVAAQIDAALALDAEADAAERDAILVDLQGKVSKINDALNPSTPAQPEELPPS
jgi:hypothetical protein